MRMLIVANTYPSLQKPNYGAFVYNLTQEFAKQANEVTIISPIKISDFFRKKQGTYGIERCEVYRPLYISLGNKKMLGIDFGKISMYFQRLSVERGVRKLKKKPNIIYCHFLSNAVSILNYSKKENLPLVVASGESSYSSLNETIMNNIPRLKESVRQFICVSNKNVEGLTSLGFDKSKMTLIPNAVDYTVFKKLDKNISKKKLNIDESKFVVGFVGHFIYRKGVNRVIEAIDLLKDDSIHMVCVGDGGELNKKKFITVLSPRPNYQLPDIYNAFDVFVLPTLSEGHCNVIEEAKACCVPIISSKNTSVENQIDDSTGVLLDPLNVKEISEGIFELKNNHELYSKMVDNLASLRGQNSIEERSKKIVEVLNKYI